MNATDITIEHHDNDHFAWTGWVSFTVELRHYTKGANPAKPFVVYGGTRMRSFSDEAKARAYFHKACAAAKAWRDARSQMADNDCEVGFLNTICDARHLPISERIDIWNAAVAEFGHDARIAAVKMGWVKDCNVTPAGMVAVGWDDEEDAWGFTDEEIGR